MKSTQTRLVMSFTEMRTPDCELVRPNLETRNKINKGAFLCRGHAVTRPSMLEGPFMLESGMGCLVLSAATTITMTMSNLRREQEVRITGSPKRSRSIWAFKGVSKDVCSFCRVLCTHYISIL